MAQRSNETNVEQAGQVAFETVLNTSKPARSPAPYYDSPNAHITAEDHHIQPFWLGRQRVYAEFSSPEDEDDAHESGCLCWKGRSIEILIFDHASKRLEVISGLDKVNNSKHIMLRLPDRSTKPIHIYKESITTDAAKCAPVFRIFRIRGKQQPENMSYKDTVYLNKLSLVDRFKVRTGQIRWLFFINLDRSLSGLSERSQGSSSMASYV